MTAAGRRRRRYSSRWDGLDCLSPSSAPAAIRTRDLRLRRPTLYPAELLAQKSGREDLNLRPPGPEPGALTGLRYAPKSRHAPRRTRTPSLLVRSQTLYPVEL